MFIPIQCSVKGCETRSRSRGWCQKHYLRFRAHGDPMAYRPNELPFRDKFKSKVELIPFSTCHWWTGWTDKYGYGQTTKDGKFIKAHRAAYEIYIGPIPGGLLVCHTCDEPSCVRPSHLFVGSHKDNAADMMKKGRWANGSSRTTPCK